MATASWADPPALTCTLPGLIYISQQALNTGSGFINCINYTTGEMLVGGTLGNCASGTRVQINDPVITTVGDIALGTGRFSRGQSPDPRFQVDQDNPTIAVGHRFSHVHTTRRGRSEHRRQPRRCAVPDHAEAFGGEPSDNAV